VLGVLAQHAGLTTTFLIVAVAGRVWQDAADPDRIVEQFVVASKIRAMTDPAHPATAAHWLTAAQRHPREDTAG
jgi:hypothetical protein